MPSRAGGAQERSPGVCLVVGDEYTQPAERGRACTTATHARPAFERAPQRLSPRDGPPRRRGLAVPHDEISACPAANTSQRSSAVGCGASSSSF